MRVVVSGASGFIGSQVARLLRSSGHAVMSLVGRRIAGFDLFTKNGRRLVTNTTRPEAFVHCAWCVDPKTYLTDLANVDHMRSTLELAEMLDDAGCKRFIGLGSCLEYGISCTADLEDRRKEGIYTKLSEGAPLAPASLYAAMKLATGLALTNTSYGGMKTAWARCFYVYGPGEHPSRLVPSVINKLSKNEEALCTSGKQVRDVLHVEDMASAICAILESDLEGVVNVGSGTPVTVAEIAKMISGFLYKPKLVRLGALPDALGHPEYRCADNKRLLSTGWQPKWSLGIGIADTIDWWAKQKSP
jgi:nucleoside-diphosphate-sugar epimerase